ncbi:LysM peptidoglycan-binding domain-containing protein [Peptococcaceae bacterium 1198_IL3148]
MKMLFRQKSPRVPSSCPSGFANRYTVKAGDTMWLIAEHYDVVPQDLIDANKHIQDPSVIFPGDVLCIPELPPKPEPVKLPSCTLLKPKEKRVSTDALGSAMIRTLADIRPGRTAISIVAHGLPKPSVYGAFNGYEALTSIPSNIAWRWILYPSMEPLTTWAGTFAEISASLTPDTVIEVRPVNTITKQTGSAILSGSLDCD